MTWPGNNGRAIPLPAKLELSGNPLAQVDKTIGNLVDSLTERVNTFIEQSPIARRYETLRHQAPYLPERDMDTPFGYIRTPELSLPELGKVTLSPEHREAFKAAVAIDISFVIGVIPVVGDILADVVEDTYGSKLRNSLTTSEMGWYTKYDKAGPSTLAVVRALMRDGMKR